MHLVKLILVTLLLASCQAPRPVDTILAVGPEAAAQAAHLGALIETSKPVQVVGELLFEQGKLGESQNLYHQYLIVLDPRLDQMESTMVLLHEWAHVLCWDRGWDEGGGHGEGWGRAYSEVYRLWVGE